MKFYSTKIVIDIGTGSIIDRDRVPYDGPWLELKPGRSKVESTALSNSANDQAGEQSDYGTAQGTLSQFEGPVQDSPYYKSLVATGTDSTTQAYNNAQENARSAANQAGFGYEQPVTQGAESGVQAQEASALAQIPSQAAAQAAPLSLEAAGQTANMGTQLGNQALGYFGDATSLEEQYQQMQQAFLNQLENAGAGVWNENPYGVFGQQ